ncbi:putative amidohydrolase [Nonomuraea thailandensis]|uniref:Amidohydrolase n=1 Tax=Nonomuraea thailandensis TaxID=1188745 RepID=A0A9X2K7Z1_9ACTN|nr:hypothetical protein [Nonomuraea thailandensis]MCP2364177.1 putative amidohydrolase [Nonomuraea thailandensis]
MSERYLPDQSVNRLFAIRHAVVHREMESMAVEAAVDSLREVLDFLTGQRVDVAVFPEYLQPAACLQDLVKFSNGRVVVAGLEEVRNRTVAEELAQADADSSANMLLNRNVSALVAQGRVRLITKRFRADPESVAPGTGPDTVEVVVRGRAVRIGVAVCLDYLRAEEMVRDANAEILCVPAYTPKLNDFYPTEPRDHVRLLANSARHGGSTIMLPSLRGTLVNRLGVQPLPVGVEGIVIVDYDRYPSRPSGLKSPDNALRLRAELIESSDRVCLDLIEELRGEPSVEQLTELIERIPRSGPLHDLLLEYRLTVAGEAPEPNLLRMAREHPVVEPGARCATVRYRQAKRVADVLSNLPPDGETSIGAATDAYRGLVARLHPGPEPVAPMEDPDEQEELMLRPEAAIPSLERELLDDLIDKAVTLQSRIRTVSGAPTPHDLLRRSFSALDTLAELADLLDILGRVSESHSGFSWHNDLGHAKDQLGVLRGGLPKDLRAARSTMNHVSRTSLAEAAQVLHNALTRLRGRTS